MRLALALFICLLPVLAFGQPPSESESDSESDSESGSESDSDSESESPIATDRPGNGNAATTVPQWRLQIETSVGYALDGDPTLGDTHRVAFPTMIRFGLLPVFELRLGSQILGIQANPPMGADTVHPTDTSVGTKVQVLANEGAVPDMALMTDVYFPSGRDPFTADAVVPDTRVALGWALPKGFGVLVNAGIDVPDHPAGRYSRFLYMASVGYSPPALDGRLGFFVESFGLLPLGVDRPTIVQLDWGATLRIGQDLQLDLFVQHGLTDAATDFQLALGFSARI